MKVPFPIRTSDGSKIRLVGKHVPRSRSAKYAARSLDLPTYDGEEPLAPDKYATPSVVSTNSDSSGNGHEVPVALDWKTAKVVGEIEPELESLPVKKKRTRSFRDKLFRGRPHSFPFKADRNNDFSYVESPIESPTQIDLPYDASVVSEETSAVSSQQDSISTATLKVQSRSVKKLAPPKPTTQVPLPDEQSFTNPFHDDDLYALADDDDEATTDSSKDAQSTFSIPLSNSIRKKSSWGLSNEPETESEDESGQVVLQERHWGKEVRSRSRDSSSWIPTEEERYKVGNGFVSGEEETEDDDDDDESTASAFTTAISTGGGTEVTGNTGASAATDATEVTNDTTSSYTGHYSGDDISSDESFSTTQSVVTGATGETSMFSLTVDESSKSVEEPRTRRPKRKRRMLKSGHNLIVEVFADLRLLAEDMADEEQGCRGCFACT